MDVEMNKLALIQLGQLDILQRDQEFVSLYQGQEWQIVLAD